MEPREDSSTTSSGETYSTSNPNSVPPISGASVQSSATSAPASASHSMEDSPAQTAAPQHSAVSPSNDGQTALSSPVIEPCPATVSTDALVAVESQISASPASIVAAHSPSVAAAPPASVKPPVSVTLSEPPPSEASIPAPVSLPVSTTPASAEAPYSPRDAVDANLVPAPVAAPAPIPVATVDTPPPVVTVHVVTAPTNATTPAPSPALDSSPALLSSVSAPLLPSLPSDLLPVSTPAHTHVPMSPFETTQQTPAHTRVTVTPTVTAPLPPVPFPSAVRMSPDQLSRIGKSKSQVHLTPQRLSPRSDEEVRAKKGSLPSTPQKSSAYLSALDPPCKPPKFRAHPLLARAGLQGPAEALHQWAQTRAGRRVAEFVPNFLIALAIYLTVHSVILPNAFPSRHYAHDGSRGGMDSANEAFPGMEDWPEASNLPRRRVLHASDEFHEGDDLDLGGAGAALPRWARDLPALTIFCAPKPYLNSPDDPQRRALLSWVRLRPQPKIMLLGSDPSFEALSREFPGVVFVDSSIDTNFYDVPMFHAMLARAQAADTPLSMLINGDIILLSDIMPAIGRVQSYFGEWLLTASRWDVATDFPYSFERDAWRGKPGQNGPQAEAEREGEIRRFVRREGSLHTYGGVDLWVWNNVPNVPLFSTHMPPFSFGRGKYDNWLVHEAVASGLRQVVDGSDALTSIHVAHSYAHVKAAGGSSAKGNFWSTRKKSSWELYANIHLAETHGTYTNQKGTALHTPWRLTSCYEPSALNMCMLKRERPANCSCEYSPYHYKTQSDPRPHHSGDFWVCGVVSADRKADFAISAVAAANSTVGLPHTMDQLLPQLARKVTNDAAVPATTLQQQQQQQRKIPGLASKTALPKDLKVVTLVAVTFGYAEMLMNFVCNLRRLGLADNLVVAALDEDLYRFAFTQGLAVFYEQASTSVRGIDQGQCQFGTKCFRQFTKLKSRAVLRVLKAGYSVLWSDVDIVWFSDPLPDLMSYGPGTFPIQSNEPNASIPGTGIRRINSGFYFARADPMTVKGFEAIVAHAAKTALSEQPSFYDILCGEKGELLLPEDAVDADGRRYKREECQWSNGLRTVFLPRDKYPNGAVHDFWNQPNVATACSGCTILHNNWISGKEAKKERLVKNGFWFYDSSRRMCIHNWHSKLRERFGDEMGVGKVPEASKA